MRLLLVDDDRGFRSLLRITFEGVSIHVREAGSAAEAAASIEQEAPDVLVLDVGLPGMDGLEFCRRLKADPATEEIRIVLLTGREDVRSVAGAVGADAFLMKPFRPLELLGIVERLAGRRAGLDLRAVTDAPEEEQLLLYARDLRHLLELERGQRAVVEAAYRQTVLALATALEAKDTGTRQHSQRVQGYALELARTLDPLIAGHPSVEYGFLLHDIGKIGIPDQILRKPAPLTAAERRLMQTHTVVGAQMLGGVSFLQGPGVEVVRSHHERWDGQGYPDRLGGEEIPLGARIFALADTLDAITSDRPYRRGQSWRVAHKEILAEAGKQFDPAVVDAFRDREHALHEIRREFLAAA